MHAVNGVGIVPVKTLARAKTRLGLDAATRARIAVYMARRVIECLVRCPCLDRVLVVAGDDMVAELATRCGAMPVSDDGRGLGPMIDHVLACSPVPWALVVMADLPWINDSDVLELVSRLAAHSVVIACDEDRLGTNALAMRLPLRWPTAFGTSNSLAAHRERAGPDASVFYSPSLAFDVDSLAHARRASEHDDRFEAILGGWA